MLIRSFTVTPGTGRTLTGLAMPYGVSQRVSDDGRTTYTEQFAPGAFTRSIAERGHKVRIFTQHDRRRLPIGRATALVERADGLYLEAEIAATRDGDDALELIRTGTVTGLSVTFQPVRNEWSRDHKSVKRLEASLREVSVVDEPAYDTARVLALRSANPPLTVELASRRLSLALKSW